MRAFCRFYDHPMIPSVRFKTISSLRGSRSKGKGVPFLSPSRDQIPPSRFNACDAGQTISNIKTLASVTPRISAISTSAVLFVVVIPRSSCIFSNSRYLAGYVKDPGKEGRVNLEKTLGKAVKLTTLKISPRLRETQNTSTYDWRNHTPPRTLLQTLAS